MATIRKIDELAGAHRMLLYIALNNPTSGDGYTVEQAVNIREVLNLLKGDAKPDARGDLDFQTMHDQPIELTEHQYNLLTDALKSMKWRTGEISIQALDSLDALKNAEKVEVETK